MKVILTVLISFLIIFQGNSQSIEELMKKQGNNPAQLEGMMKDILGAMNKDVDLPDKYSFDVRLKCKVTDEDGETNLFDLLFSKNEEIFGVNNAEMGAEENLVVMDSQRDAVVMYSETDGTKEYRVIPGAMSGAMSMAEDYQVDENDKSKVPPIQATGNNLMVAGHNCLEYLMQKDGSEIYMYFTKELDLDWQSSYGGIIKRFSKSTYDSAFGNVEGIMLKSISKEKDGSTTIWETYEVDEKGVKINNKEYKQVPFGM